MQKVIFTFFFVCGIFMISTSCEEIRSYPETPEVDYKAFRLFISTDALGNEILLGQLEFDFSDGDGNIGMQEIDTMPEADSLRYNLFMSLYDYTKGEFEKIEDLSSLNYRIPYIERQGQNKTLTGTVTVDIEYKTLEYDTIFYTFYITDRDLNKSNTDTTELIVLSFPEEEL